MKSCGQQKNKLIKVSPGIPVKKSATVAGRRRQKPTGIMVMPQIQLHIPPAKIKMQLFPLDENTHLGLEKVGNEIFLEPLKPHCDPADKIPTKKEFTILENLTYNGFLFFKDGHNPFLELTLSVSKKISSVVRHLNTKWGSSSVAIGQLMIFPYHAKLEQLASFRRWTSDDSATTAGDVHIAVGSPSMFRLRYGWCPSFLLEMFYRPPKSGLVQSLMVSEHKISHCSKDLEIQNLQEKNLDVAGEGIQKQIDVNEAQLSDANEPRSLGLQADHMNDKISTDVYAQSTMPWDDNFTNLSIGGLLSEISLQGKIIGPTLDPANKSGMQPIGLISDISIGALLSEASRQGKVGDPNMKSENKSTLQPIFLTSSDISIGGLLSEASLLSNKSNIDTPRMEVGNGQLQSPWDDSFTTLSIGGLLSEASLQAKAGLKLELRETKTSFQPNAPLSDSFGAFFDAQINLRPQVPKSTYQGVNMSILDAEETCHAFPIQKLQKSNRDAVPSDLVAGSGSSCANLKSSAFLKVDKNEFLGPCDHSQPPGRISGVGGGTILA